MNTQRLKLAVTTLVATGLILAGATGCSSADDAKDAGQTLQGYQEAVLDLGAPTLKGISNRSTLKQREPDIAKLVDLDASTDAGVASSMKFFFVMKGLTEGASLRYEVDPTQINVDGSTASVPDKALGLYIAGKKDLPASTSDDTKYRLNKINGKWLVVLDDK